MIDGIGHIGHIYILPWSLRVWIFAHVQRDLFRLDPPCRTRQHPMRSPELEMVNGLEWTLHAISISKQHIQHRGLSTERAKGVALATIKDH